MIWRCGVEQDTQPDNGALQNNTTICNKAGANPAAALNIPARIPFRVADSAPSVWPLWRYTRSGTLMALVRALAMVSIDTAV